ncbi:Hypothetical protein NTJ_08080 [Nesidiocoris tenuis]|uniref:Uncharacterized protein n=1 Tax=Nesidiocoris tenuis TaxID=355587 RepID=A0ABN7AST1_9HEMI|nr:Hypothetical protein NTJ_08080 [Nesidiocoris tenuis]
MTVETLDLNGDAQLEKHLTSSLFENKIHRNEARTNANVDSVLELVTSAWLQITQAAADGCCALLIGGERLMGLPSFRHALINGQWHLNTRTVELDALR